MTIPKKTKLLLIFIIIFSKMKKKKKGKKEKEKKTCRSSQAHTGLGHGPMLLLDRGFGR
jgi:hypothetical protein